MRRKPGMTEKELVAIIGATMYRSGATAGTKPLFVNCVSGRTRYPLVDSPASDNVIGDGDIVFVDGGGASDGYVSDILRLIGVGRLRDEDRRYADAAADATAGDDQRAAPGRAGIRAHRDGRGRRSQQRASPSKSARSPATASAWSSGSAR